MYNIVNDLFYTTCTSGIQQTGSWYYTLPTSWPTGGNDYGADSNTTIIDTNVSLPPNSVLAGVSIRCNIPATFVVKIAGTADRINWRIIDVATVTVSGSTGYQYFYFTPKRVPSDYPLYYLSLYFASGLSGSNNISRVNLPSIGTSYMKSTNITGYASGFSFDDRYYFIKAHIATIVELPSQGSKLSFPITLTSGTYVGLEFQSQSEIQCSEIMITTSPTPSGIMKIDYAQFAGDQLSSDGVYNNNTGYATPKMTYHDEPAGYRASASSEVAGYWPYEAFTQTNATTGDSWQSANTQMSGTAPHCLMFTFSGTGKVINRYQILTRNDSNASLRGAPRDWVLQGTNDTRAVAYNDAYWASLDTRTSISDPGQNAWSSIFNFNNAQAYSRYRLRITARNNQAVSYYYVCIGELKLIEADQIYSYPTYSWYPGNWVTSSGAHHQVTFSPEKGLDRIRLFFGNSGSSPLTVSGVSIMVRGTDEITMSGTLPTLRYTFSDTDPQFLDIKNTGSGSAFPRLSLSYTGNYEVDRNIFISTDYSTQYDKEEAHWEGLDSGGFLIPEQYPWELGTLSGSVVYRRNLQLPDTSYSGSWLSPVFDTERNPVRLYVYPTGGVYPQIEVKSADTQPAEAIFSIITTENTHEKLMYKHKRIVLDSNGYVISRVECNSPQVGNKIWRMADYTFAGQPLNYYGAVNSRGTASFMAPGYTTCGDIDPVQEALDPLQWYNLCVCKLDDTSLWNTGTSVSGFEWGPTKSVIYTKTFPLESSDGVFFSAISTSTSQELTADVRTQVNMGFYNNGQVMMAFPIITYRGVKLGATDYYDVVEDYANNGWWIYLGGSIGRVYKTDVGSFNTIRVFGAGELTTSQDPLDNCEYYSYLYYLDIESDYKHIVSIPNRDFSGFWAFTASGVHLFKEEYTNETPSLDNVRQIEAGTIISGSFVDLHQGACDSLGNLWLVDLDAERLMRVNLKRSLDLNDPNPVDFDNYISGIINVFPHPTSELAYVLCSESIENPDQDTIHMVSAGQSVGAHSKFVCAVPGFLSSTYKRCVNFTGTTFTNYYRTRSADSIWGLNAGGWYTISNTDLLPRGRYSQFRLTLSRPSLTKTTPSVQRLRLPFPITLEPLDKLQTRQVAIKTVFNRAKTFGIFNTNLLVWWFDEEFYYG